MEHQEDSHQSQTTCQFPMVDLNKHVLKNVVSTVDLGCKLDLKHIALRDRNAEYKPMRFAAVIMRMQDPKTTALIFGSGKMVCTGAKSVDNSKIAARKFARLVRKMGFPVKFKDFNVISTR